MGKKLYNPVAGDVFAVPLANGDSALGQVVSFVDEMGSAGCAFFQNKLAAEGALPTLVKPISVLLVTPEQLRRRQWPVLRNLPVDVPTSLWGWEKFRDKKWVGAVIVGSGIVNEFLAAYHGVAPWDAMGEPNYFDKLLVSGAHRPKSTYLARG